jgi:hypothetical protein
MIQIFKKQKQLFSLHSGQSVKVLKIKTQTELNSFKKYRSNHIGHGTSILFLYLNTVIVTAGTFVP